jgi:hypothetical protein
LKEDSAKVVRRGQKRKVEPPAEPTESDPTLNVGIEEEIIDEETQGECDDDDLFAILSQQEASTKDLSSVMSLLMKTKDENLKHYSSKVTRYNK